VRFLCRRYAVRMDDHCGLLGLTQCYACEKLEALDKLLPKGPAGDHGQVGWMGGEFDR
jgi:hypothetical protein